MAFTIGRSFPMGLIIFLPIISFAQGQDRMIDKLSWRTEPIKILKLKTKDKPIELGRRFPEEDDWLRGLTVTVKNMSDKAIARIELHLRFVRPEGAAEDIPTYVVPMVYGRDPADSGPELLTLVQPGEIANVKLVDANLPLINTDIRRLGYPEKITHTQLTVESVTFVDGTTWAGDEILYPDPNNPKRKTNPKFPTIKQTPSVSKPSLGQSHFSASHWAPFRKANFLSVRTPMICILWSAKPTQKAWNYALREWWHVLHVDSHFFLGALTMRLPTPSQPSGL